MEILDPLQHPDWDQLVLEHPHSSIFHSSAWARVLMNAYHHRPLYLCHFEGSEALALVPLMEVQSPWTGTRGVSLPFTDTCVPLLSREGLWEVVIEELKSLCSSRGWRHFELRGARSEAAASCAHSEYLEHRLDLETQSEGLFARFSDPTRRAIRKSIRCKIRVEISQSRAALHAYYFLHCKTRQRHGIPPQPLAFFECIGRELLEQGHGFVALGYLDAQPISGAVYFHFGANAVYKFGASDAMHQECRANNLVMWAAIQRLQEMGIKTLHWGRTSQANPGLRRFKLGWATSEQPLCYLRWQQRSQSWVRARDRAQGIHNFVFSHLPAPCNAVLGRLMYPHLD